MPPRSLKTLIGFAVSSFSETCASSRSDSPGL